MLVLIPALHRGVMPALEYARSLSPDCRAVHICTDPERTPQLRERWEQWGHDVPLVILNSPYRSLISPIMRYLDAVQHERRNHIVTVVVPEFVATRKWQRCCTVRPGLLLKLALLSRRDVVVANVRYYLQHSDSPPPADALAEEETVQPAHGHNGHAPAAKTHGKVEVLVPQPSEYDPNAPVPGSAQALAAVPYDTENAPNAAGTLFRTRAFWKSSEPTEREGENASAKQTK